jgi:TRAP-type mannitol/chloroaromatic compound transport system permease small subunit
MAIFTWSSFQSGRTSISSGTLLWIPQLAITLGMLLFALQMLSRVLQAILDLPMEDERMKPAASLE